jgi:hypothetical protein
LPQHEGYEHIVGFKFFLVQEQTQGKVPIGTHICKILGRVKSGKGFVKWGKTDEKILNGVISVKNINLGGKNWNLLLKKSYSDQESNSTTFLSRKNQINLERKGRNSFARISKRLPIMHTKQRTKRSRDRRLKNKSCPILSVT